VHLEQRKGSRGRGVCVLECVSWGCPVCWFQVEVATDEARNRRDEVLIVRNDGHSFKIVSRVRESEGCYAWWGWRLLHNHAASTVSDAACAACMIKKAVCRK